MVCYLQDLPFMKKSSWFERAVSWFLIPYGKSCQTDGRQSPEQLFTHRTEHGIADSLFLQIYSRCS